MIKVYAMLVILGLLGGVGYAGYSYYTSTQQRIQTLAENNAKLEVAVQTAEASVSALNEAANKNAKLTIELQNKLQKAEAYGDNLRKKLRKLDLIGDALRDPENLEGRMNGATAKIWRDIMGDSGGANDLPLPNWLQQDDAGTGSKGSNNSTTVDSATSSPPKAN
jgi:hypothetical protein